MKKYIQLSDELRKNILNEKYKKGEILPSESNLQIKSGFSRYTVRQAIDILVKEGLLVKKHGSGTYVANTTEELKAKKNKTIGVIITYVSEYIFPSIIRGLEKVISEKGYSLLLGITNNNHDQERECLKKMLDQNVDGLIVEPTKSNEYNPNIDYYMMLEKRKTPMIMLNATYEEFEVSNICVNDKNSGYLATKYLIEKNHKNLLLVTKIDDLQGKYRMKGFIKAIKENVENIEKEEIIAYKTENKREIIKEICDKLSNTENKITGIVAYNDEIAIEIINVLREKNIKIPEKISIIGNDDSNLSESFGLTTLEHPKEKMGELAGKYIVEMIEEKQQKIDFCFEPVLIERKTVKKI